MKSLTIILAAGLLGCVTIFGQAGKLVAPGAPGGDAHWSTAAKNGFGTSVTTASKVWFTLADGVLTEVYYPTLDVPNVQTLQLVIADAGAVETEAEDTLHQTELVDPRSLSFRQINTAKSGNYKIVKTYLTDPQHSTVLIDIQFESRTLTKLFVYYDPSLNNSGMHDTAWALGDALFATDGDKSCALISSLGFGRQNQRKRRSRGPLSSRMSNGFLGVNDGLTEIRRNPNSPDFTEYARAENGNVVQLASLEGISAMTDRPNQQPISGGRFTAHFTLALGFGRTAQQALTNARASLSKGFAQVQREYRIGWHRFVMGLPHVGAKYQSQFNVAAMTLHGLEDKTYRGATIASPSIPWGGGPNANEATVSGYHAVWSRDLYQVATALIALGDRAGANRALDYLLRLQQKPDGSFPQNSRVNGAPIGGGLQMDQVALPLVLAFQLGRTEKATWLRHLKPAADFIVLNGPATHQERWEEKSGYSPSTIAAEIAGLVCAAHIARFNGDRSSEARYLTKADDWSNNVERWTATATGRYRDGNYYLRISDDNDPNDGAKIEINSGGGTYDERDIVDAGFLELVRLGIRGADDPLILKSLKMIDGMIKVETPRGPAWYRYNHDAYGERADGGPYDGRSGVGRLWTLLTGERGEFELAHGDRNAAIRCLDALGGFANAGMMIPEQVWDRADSPAAEFRFANGTGSATPLAWSMAQFIRLAINLKTGRNLETPEVVAARYLKNAASLGRKRF